MTPPRPSNRSTPRRYTFSVSAPRLEGIMSASTRSTARQRASRFVNITSSSSVHRERCQTEIRPKQCGQHGNENIPAPAKQRGQIVTLGKGNARQMMPTIGAERRKVLFAENIEH